MTLPELTPSWDEFVAAVAAALTDEKGRVYLDANVLIHCYEMNVAASEDLLAALEGFDGRVRVPAWAAKETWDFTTGRITRFPLEGQGERVRKELVRFQKESTRFIDGGALKDGSDKEGFLAELGESIDDMVKLMKRVQKLETKSDLTTARLFPFIDARVLTSDLVSILDEVSRTAPTRMAHRIPPGFADVGTAAGPGDEAGDDARQSGRKGKTKNPYGDLIVWLEILQDCNRAGVEKLILITKDTSKGDFVYQPAKFKNAKGQPQQNNGLITLPLPMMSQEARARSNSVSEVHILSVEMLAHVLQSMKIDVTNLAQALQADAEVETPEDAADEGPPAAAADDATYKAVFDSRDMDAALDPTNPIDAQIIELNGEGWTAQNQAVRRLMPLLRGADRSQRIQIGRGLAEAAKDGALASADFLTRAFEDAGLGVAVRSDLMIGVLASVYIDEDGLPKKPVSPPRLTEVLFSQYAKAELQPAYDAVLERCRPHARKYLSLPNEPEAPLNLTLSRQGDELQGVEASGSPLLEYAAASAQALTPSGAAAETTTDALIDLLAQEFVVPRGRLVPDTAAGAAIIIPAQMGFVAWGPNTGTLLR